MPEKPLRIAYLVSRYPALTHTFILWEIAALRDLGFEIDVIAIRRADRQTAEMTPLERLEQERTLSVLPFGLHFVRAHLATLFSHPKGYLAGIGLALKPGNRTFRSALFQLIYFMEAVVAGHIAKKRGHYHIHTHFSSTVGLLAARIFAFDLSITLHGPDEFRDAREFRMREKLAASRFIVTISQYAKGQIMQASDRRDWHKIRVCPLGVDTSALSSRPVPVNSEALQLIFVGRLAPVKAVHVLIEACGHLLSQGYRLHLRVVGSGDCREDLEKLVSSLGIERNVVFEGGRNHDEVIAFYRQSDIFALSSLAEGVPVVLMEAMAMEIPCAATWINGIPELIEDHAEGILVPPSDPLALANAIGELMRNPELRQKMGRAAREKVVRDYDLKTNTERLAVIFQEELQARNGSRTLPRSA